MYTRFCIVFKRFQSSLHDEIFFHLTNDCHRKHFVHHELLCKAIKNIHSNLSEKQSLLILNAAAQYIHHVTPDKRVELLEEVIGIDFFHGEFIGALFSRFGRR